MKQAPRVNLTYDEKNIYDEYKDQGLIKVSLRKFTILSFWDKIKQIEIEKKEQERLKK